MARRPLPKTTRAKKAAAPAKRKKWSASRGRTVKSNGSVDEPIVVAPDVVETVTIGEAMRIAVEKLGDITIDPTLAVGQLRELGEVVEEIARRQAAFDAKSEEAKTAKKSLESAQELLQEKTRSFTHPSPLPLFDHQSEEDDRAEMLSGGDVEELGTEEATH
jgi:hypothetical protein